MPEESFEEKTEQPTPRKREDVRKKGEVAKSRELPSVAVLLCGLVCLTLFGSYMYGQIQTSMKEAFSLITVGDLSLADFMIFAERMVTSFILAMTPLLAAVVIGAVFSNIMQVGFMLSGELIKPKLSKLDPIKGFGRLFSKQSFMELFKSLLKLAIVGVIAYWTIKGEMKHVPVLGEMETSSILSCILLTVLKIFIRCTLAMIFLVVIDYAFQRWEFEKKIKMSKKEVKDEFKRTEGDPLIKSRIKSIQMQMARRRMMQAVPQADVVITNPTTLAVALKYDSTSMGAPRLLAKGSGKIAAKIKELAMKHDIPILENRELARSLHTLVEVGEEIPPVLYQAVAEVLAYVYRLYGKHAYANERRLGS
jgi:flagellar biosynthetic protein FlhB